MSRPSRQRRDQAVIALRRSLRHAINRAGYELVPKAEADMEESFWPLHARIAPYTMTTPERAYGLFKAVEHVVAEGIPGDVVECGVWRGGSSMLAALALEAGGSRDRTLWLYDTFEGMSAPTEADVDSAGRAALGTWEHSVRKDHNAWCYASLDDVRANLDRTGYPTARVRYVVGKVEDTIPDAIPERIALLRLDTDWYESTHHELEHLYPRLEPGGVLVVDDYGFWAGARQAVDEYFAGRPRPLLVRLDHTGRMGVKPPMIPPPTQPGR